MNTLYWELILDEDDPDVNAVKGRCAQLTSPPGCDNPPETVSFRDITTGFLVTFMREDLWDDEANV